MVRRTVKKKPELETLRQLARAAGKNELELAEPNGKVLGYFVPAKVREERLYQEAMQYAMENREELDRRSRSKDPGISTKELIKRLEALG